MAVYCFCSLKTLHTQSRRSTYLSPTYSPTSHHHLLISTISPSRCNSITKTKLVFADEVKDMKLCFSCSTTEDEFEEGTSSNRQTGTTTEPYKSQGSVHIELASLSSRSDSSSSDKFTEAPQWPTRSFYKVPRVPNQAVLRPEPYSEDGPKIMSSPYRSASSPYSDGSHELAEMPLVYPASQKVVDRASESKHVRGRTPPLEHRIPDAMHSHSSSWEDIFPGPQHPRLYRETSEPLKYHRH